MEALRRKFKQTFVSYSDRCAFYIFFVAAAAFLLYQVIVFSTNLSRSNSNPVVQFRISPQNTFNPAMRMCWNPSTLFAIGMLQGDYLHADWYIADFNVTLPEFWTSLSDVSQSATTQGGADVTTLANYTLRNLEAYTMGTRRCANFNADGVMRLDSTSNRPSYDVLIYAYTPQTVINAVQQSGQLVTPPMQMSYTLYHPDTDPLLASVRSVALNNNANYLAFDLQIRVSLDGSSTYTYNSQAVPQGGFGLNSTVFAETLRVTNPQNYVLNAIYCEVTTQSYTVTTLEETKVYDFSGWLSDLGGTISIIGTVFGLIFPTLSTDPRHLRFAKKWTERTRTATQQQSSEFASPPASPHPQKETNKSDDSHDTTET